jgi:hypothetical protein
MNEEVKKEYAMLVAKKSERLVTALYLVTDLIADTEPIKHGLRKNAVALLSSMNSLSQRDVKDRLTEFKVSLRAVTEITSLLHVAATTGIVSEMNSEILMEGFRALQLVLEKKQPILTKDMLTVENEEALGADATFSAAITSTSYDALTPLTLSRDPVVGNQLTSVRDSRFSQDTVRQARLLAKLGATEDTKKTLKTEIKDTSNESVRSTLIEHSDPRPTTLASSFQMRKQSRREQVLSLFVKGVDVGIKDIASRIRGCSEKTIQRELNALLYDNVIERIGEKRWSRYILR